MRHDDDCSDFRSAIEWWPDVPYRPSEQGAFGSLGAGAVTFVEVAKNAQKIAPICESPIETMLGARLAVSRDRWDAAGFPKFKMVVQHKLGGFRFDFAILTTDGKLLAAIECDGKEFHSTAAQLANDKAKDAAVAEAGAAMFRFTGSDIFKHDGHCADAVFDLLRQAYGISQEQWDAIPNAKGQS
jgi:very-short-patch-repair endonuclease